MYKINKQKGYIVEHRELCVSGNLSCSVVSDFCNPMDCSPPVSSVHGILQARILELGGHFLLRGIFLTQGLNWSLLRWQVNSFFFFQPWTLLFEYLQLLFYTQTLISYKTLYSILLGHVTLNFMSHFHQELFPQTTIFLIVCCCCSVAKLCLILCDPMDCSPPGSSVHGILQARILEWVATSFSRGSSRPGVRPQVFCIAGRFFTS